MVLDQRADNSNAPDDNDNFVFRCNLSNLRTLQSTLVCTLLNRVDPIPLGSPKTEINEETSVAALTSEHQTGLHEPQRQGGQADEERNPSQGG
jgi:hypothetical protein